MRNKLALMLVLLAAFCFAMTPIAYASGVMLAQAESEEGTEVENEGGDQADPGTDTDQGEGAGGGDDLGEGGEGEPSAETGAGEDEQATTEEEAGPQWTYQMSRITLVMLFLLLLAMGALYYRMVGRRQRGV